MLIRAGDHTERRRLSLPPPKPRPEIAAASQLYVDRYVPAAPPAKKTPRPKTTRCGALFHSRAIAQLYALMVDHALWGQQNAALTKHFGDAVPDAPKVMDLGSGTGVGTIALGEVLEGKGEVVGVDFSEVMVGRAQRQLCRPRSVRFAKGDATDLSAFRTNSQDYVVANSFLYLVPDPAAVLREVRRVLRPGGRVVFMEPREEGSFLGAVRAGLGKIVRALRTPLSSIRLGAAMCAWRVMSGLEGRMTEAQLKALFKDAGFSTCRLQPTLGGLGNHVIAE